MLWDCDRLLPNPYFVTIHDYFSSQLTPCNSRIWFKVCGFTKHKYLTEPAPSWISPTPLLGHWRILRVLWIYFIILQLMRFYAEFFYLIRLLGTAVAQWLRCCATNRKVAGSIPDGVSGFFVDTKSFRSHYGPGVDSASNRNEYQEHFLGVNAAGA